MSPTEFLAGVNVVSIAQNLPGPLACARLRQAGARVTKIEPPDGDPFLALSPAWHAEMHEGITVERVDLKSDNGRPRLMSLLTECDVLLTSQRPSALARLSLDPATLRTRTPQLRILRIVGSLADPEQPGHDLTYQAQRGLVGDLTPDWSVT
jgi:alpha-methylacyl-CoA racemase